MASRMKVRALELLANSDAKSSIFKVVTSACNYIELQDTVANTPFAYAFCSVFSSLIHYA